MHAQASPAAPDRPCISSTDAVAWAWRQTLPAIAKLALLCVASERGEDGPQTLIAVADFCSINLEEAADTVLWLINHGYLVQSGTGVEIAGDPL